MPAENRPLFPTDPPKAYYDRLFSPQGWTSAVTLNLSIGQGASAQTLINMTAFYAALAGDGIKRAPFIVQGRQRDIAHDMGLTQPQLQGLRDAMVAVVQGGAGLAAGDIRLMAA